MIVAATWPLLLRAQAWLGGKRSLAVALMTLILLLILVVPLYFGGTTIADHAEQIADWSQSVATLTVPQPPAWVEGVPLVGTWLAGSWQQLAAAGPEEWSARLAPYAQKFVLWFVGQVGSIGLLLVQFVLTVIIAAVLYSNGETVASGADRFARRLAGPQGENALHLAAQAGRRRNAPFANREVLRGDREHYQRPTVEKHLDPDEETDHPQAGYRPLLPDEDTQQEIQGATEQQPSLVRRTCADTGNDTKDPADDQEHCNQ